MIEIESEIQTIIQKMGLNSPKEADINYIHRIEDTMIGYMENEEYPYFVAEFRKNLVDEGNISLSDSREILSHLFKYLEGNNSYNKEIRKHIITAKSGRVFKRLYPELPDKIVADFVARFNKIPPHFELWADVTKGYIKNDKTGVHSCMSSDCFKGEKRWQMDFYEKNGVKLLVLIKDKSVVGRALIWPDIKFETIGIKTLMDRVFVNNSKHDGKFRKYANEQGWVIREHRRDFEFNGKDICADIDYEMKDTNIVFWPYTDTFTCARDIKKRTFLNNYGEGVAINSGFVCPLPIEVYSEYEKKDIIQREAIQSVVGWISISNSAAIDGKFYPLDMTIDCAKCNNRLPIEGSSKNRYGKTYCKECGVDTLSGERELKENCVKTYNDKWIMRLDAVECRGELYYINDPRIIKDDFTYTTRREQRELEIVIMVDPEGKEYTNTLVGRVDVTNFNYWIDDKTGYFECLK